MAAHQGRGLRPGGVVRALGRLALLVGFGFVAGLLIGVLAEEPELLAGHLRGESEAIVLTPPSDAPPAEESTSEAVSVEVVQADAEAPPPARREAQTAASALPEVAAAPPPSSDTREWAIQVGAFSDEGAASRLAQGLRKKGYPVELLAARSDAERWRVRVQPIRGEAEANAISARLKRVERLPTWIIPMEARSGR